MALKLHEFSLGDFLTLVAHRKRKYALVVVLSAVVGIVVAFSIPKVYVSTIELVSEEQGVSGGMTGGMGSLASLAGVKMGSVSDAISPDLYPTVVSSNQFLVDLLKVQVETNKEGKRMSLSDYQKKMTKMAWWSYPMYWLGKGIEKLKADTLSARGKGVSINPEHLTAKEEREIKELRGQTQCMVDEETNVISISFRAQDPLVAKMMVDTMAARLQTFITEYRTNKSKVDLNYYRKLEGEANRAYEQARKKYAAFCDTHMGIELQSYIQEQENLENELQMAFTQYSNYKQQVASAEAKVQERTPVFTIVDKASVPIKAESPRKLLLLIAFVLLGVVGYSGKLYGGLLFGGPDAKDAPTADAEVTADEAC